VSVADRAHLKPGTSKDRREQVPVVRLIVYDEKARRGLVCGQTNGAMILTLHGLHLRRRTWRRNAEMKGGALARRAREGERAPENIRKAATDRETESGTFTLPTTGEGLDERGKNPLRIGRFDTRTRIRHLDAQETPGVMGPQHHLALLRELER